MKLEDRILAYEYLDAYRQHSNPLAAGNDLRESLAMDRKDARDAIEAWSESYSPDLTAEQRATLDHEAALQMEALRG
jgi:hypothetical protein